MNGPLVCWLLHLYCNRQYTNRKILFMNKQSICISNQSGFCCANETATRPGVWYWSGIAAIGASGDLRSISARTLRGRKQKQPPSRAHVIPWVHSLQNCHFTSLSPQAHSLYLLHNALRPFQIYCAPPNLDIRTWICRLNFAHRTNFEPEISDSGPPA